MTKDASGCGVGGTCFGDLGFPDVRLAVEFDGELKYDDDIEHVLREERPRQRSLEEAGWMVIRIRWEELRDLAALEQRLRRAYLAARRRALLGLTA